MSTKRGLSQDQLTGIQAQYKWIVPDTLVHNIVEDLSTDWPMLGRRLGLSEGVIKNIDSEHRRVTEKGVAMFNQWKQRKPTDATTDALSQGLEQIGRRDLSERVGDFALKVQQRLFTGSVGYEQQHIETANERPFPSLQDLGIELPSLTNDMHLQPEEQAKSKQRPLAARDVRDPSFTMPPAANNLLTNATAETPEANSRQVHESAYARGLTGQDFTDHGPDTSTRTSVPVQSAAIQKLASEGSFLDPKKYCLVKKLGSGGYAKVYLCKSKETGSMMAVKVCDLGENHHEIQKQVDAVAREVTALKAVKHKNIVEFFYTETSCNALLLFLEYMKGGSVEDLLRHKGPIKEPLVRKFTRQILTAVDFLHNNKIIHKDIKGGNVLLDERQMNIKIADFGISKNMQKLKTATGGLKTSNRAFSLYWTSPELIDKKSYEPNTDIWSVACTVVEMLTTKPPLMEEDLDISQVICKIVRLEVQPPRNCSSLAYGLIEKCLCASNVRPSAAKLLQTDPFVNFTEEERNQLADLLIDIDH